MSWKTELRRKSIHLFGLSVPAIYWATDKQAVLLFVGVSLFAFVAFELYRIKRGFPVPQVDALARPLTRVHERRGLGAHVYFAAGAAVAIMAYPKEVAIAVLLMAVLADGGAAVVGTRWGKRRLVGKKTLEGTLTFFGVALVISAWYVRPWAAALAGATAGALVELAPVNDNLSVPIAGGLAMSLTRYLV